MKIRVVLLLPLLIILAFSGCERYRKTTQPEDTSFQEKLEAFSRQIEASVIEQDITALMPYYDDNYLSDGLTRVDVRIFFNDLAAANPDSIKVGIAAYNKTGLSFTYRIISYKNSTVEIDTTIAEYTLRKEDDYLLTGNGEGSIISPQRKVLVEVFTSIDCINCIYLKSALNSLKRRYGNLFYYIEYHQRNEFDFGNADIYNYYAVRSVPTGIIQGSSRIRGSNGVEDSYGAYEYAVTELFDNQADYFFEDFEYRTSSDSLFFTVTVTTTLPAQVFRSQDLQLKYALIDKETELAYYEQQPLRNVVITKGAIPATMTHNQELLYLEAAIPLPQYNFYKPALILWLQTINRPYNAETCVVENVFEQRLLLD